MQFISHIVYIYFNIKNIFKVISNFVLLMVVLNRGLWIIQYTYSILHILASLENYGLQVRKKCLE